MLRKSLFLLPVLVFCLCGWALAGATISDPDSVDTEHAPIDFRDIYVYYDASNVYVTYGHDHDGWGGVQVGVAFVTVSGAGGTTDPWAHQIAFGGLCLPDYIAYLDIDSPWNEWCVWNGVDWDRTPNILNWNYLPVPPDPDVLTVPFDLLGIDCLYDGQILIELWITQNGGTKGPLDLSYNDDLQLSTPTGTIWDIEEPVIISCYHCLDFYAPSAAEPTTWGGIKGLWK